jgi:UPF0042 nucleotide-binding protein
MATRRRVVIVTGLSGGGKASVLRVLEDLGYQAVDNLPVPMIEQVVGDGERNLVIGVDTRTSGFNVVNILKTLVRLRGDPRLRPELVYMWAEETTLLRRYTETRRRHPMAPQGRVADGISLELHQTASLREAADLSIDTSDLPIPALRQLIEGHFGPDSAADAPSMVVSLISFAYPQGLPREADLVFDVRFLRNPHYVPALKPHTGLDADVGAYVSADEFCGPFFDRLAGMVEMLLPRFAQEGKKYVSIAVGCTGGRHRSVYVVERLSAHLAERIAECGIGWRLHVTHRELAREGLSATYLADIAAARVAERVEPSGPSFAAPVSANHAGVREGIVDADAETVDERNRPGSGEASDPAGRVSGGEEPLPFFRRRRPETSR